MKQLSMLIFLIVILSIHTLVNLYIYNRGLQGLEAMPQIKPIFKIVMLTLFLSYIIGRFLEKVWISPVSDIFHWVGAFWFAGMLYSVFTIPFDEIHNRMDIGLGCFGYRGNRIF
jgi:hypothetical protein